MAAKKAAGSKSNMAESPVEDSTPSVETLGVERLVSLLMEARGPIVARIIGTVGRFSGDGSNSLES